MHLAYLKVDIFKLMTLKVCEGIWYYDHGSVLLGLARYIMYV